MKEIISILPLFLKLITPDPAMKGVRLEKKELKLQLKNLRIAKRMLKSIIKEFKDDGFDDEEKDIISSLRRKILQRQTDLI